MWNVLVEGTLGVKLLTLWTVGKARWKSRGGKKEKRREEERISEKRKSRKKEDAGARKGRKVTDHCVFFQCFAAPEGGQVGSLKRRAGTP